MDPDPWSSEHFTVPGAWHWNSIDSATDEDTYGIYLNGGQWYDFDVYGYSGFSGYVGDPTLEVRDWYSGYVHAYNDDSGGTLNSHIDFCAPYSGWYELGVEGYGSNTGSYLLVA